MTSNPGNPVRSRPSGRPERLQKLLAAAGLGSRREIEAWIAAGRVLVNGRIARLGDRASAADDVIVDDKKIRFHASTHDARVLLYHKPVGELVTRSDPQGRRTVFSRLPKGRWVCVGRLDLNTSGLLLVTDDGELANRLMHPRYGIEREYRVRVLGGLQPESRRRLLRGVSLDGERAAFDSVEPADARRVRSANRWFRVTLREGRNREVRRLFEALGLRVSRLVRVRFGPIALPRELAPGAWRELSAGEKAVILQKVYGAEGASRAA